jgi:putative ATP-dependent endonuclease of OLD family
MAGLRGEETVVRLRKLTIRNFRGIQSCQWEVPPSFVALVGPGDSTKTSLLDAVGLVLSPRYNVAFTDADFHKCDPTKPIEICAVVSDLPDALVTEGSHGKNRSGITAEGELVHDPTDDPDIEECLIIRLRVDQTLEPSWEVLRTNAAEGDRISAADRGRLGFFRIGDAVDTHLRWGRGSALTTLTASKAGVASAVVEAQRQARSAVEALKGTPLHDAASTAQERAKHLGAGSFSQLRPGLDPSVGSTSAALVLHNDAVPLTQYGLGSRRLLSLSIQEGALEGNSVIAIDEIESGLDPHRLLHVLGYLRRRANEGTLQVFLTTHSPLVVEGLSNVELAVVRSVQGKTTVTGVPAQLDPTNTDRTQGVIRSWPSALLASDVVVGEGPTEVGFLMRLLLAFDGVATAESEATSVSRGVAVANGNGSSQAPQKALALQRLGYGTFLLIDGDTDENQADVDQAVAGGVALHRWPDGQALEDVLASELSLLGLQNLVDLATSERSAESVLSAVRTLSEHDLKTTLVEDWMAALGEPEVRRVIGLAAQGERPDGTKKSQNAWFKRQDRGWELGKIVENELCEMPAGGGLAEGIRALLRFTYADDRLWSQAGGK